MNGSCTDATPVTGYYSWNNTSPFCAYEFPVDGINYTTKYTALKFKIMERALLAQNRTILYSLCEWGASFLDSINFPVLRMLTVDSQVLTRYGHGETPPEAHGECPTISALAKVSRDLLSHDAAADSRTASWGRILEILNVNSFLLDWTDFWGRNDPDMLEVWPSPQKRRS